MQDLMQIVYQMQQGIFPSNPNRLRGRENPQRDPDDDQRPSDHDGGVPLSRKKGAKTCRKK